MEIRGFDARARDDLAGEVARGGRFVLYQYCMSVLVLTFRRASAVHWIPGGSSAIVPGLRFSLLSFLTGWWGIPWGPIYTIGAIVTNFRGGRDITSEVLYILQAEGEVPGRET